jgi:UDP-3-O-[3-hydroxymyristoyl] glucosamine N-acyltransferase
MQLKDIANKIGAKIIGDENIEISSIANLVTAKKNNISFLSDKKMHKYLSKTEAGAVIIKESDIIEGTSTSFLVVSDPYVSYALVAQIFDTTPACAEGIAESAVIHPTAILGENVSIGPNVVIEAGVQLGDGVQIGALSYVGKNTKIGKNTKLWANVTIYHNCIIGEDCLFQSGVVIGSDGFGYANNKGLWVKIPQVGRVVIGNHVEIGANTAIDRGAVDDTVIADNVILDNLIQIAHNDKIGFGTAIAGGTVVAGSVDIGKYCIIGGTSTFNGHIKVCDGSQILGQVGKDITTPGKYTAYLPVLKDSEWTKILARILRLSKMNDRLCKVEAKLAEDDKKESSIE